MGWLLLAQPRPRVSCVAHQKISLYVWHMAVGSLLTARSRNQLPDMKKGCYKQ